MTSRKSKMDPESPVFRCLDCHADIEKTQRNLPHWFQVGAAIFVTFRSADSMPTEVVLRFQQELEHWLKRNGLPLELAQRNPGEAKVAAIVPNCDLPETQVPPPKLTQFKKLRLAPGTNHSTTATAQAC